MPIIRRLERHRDALDTCTFCPKLCRAACPVASAEARETVTPWGLMTRINLVRRGAAPLDADTVATWQHCTMCGACTQYCKHEVDVATVIRAARTEADHTGCADTELLAWSREPRPDMPAFSMLPEGGEVVLLPGYADASVVEAAVAVLRAIGYPRLGRPQRGVFASGARLRDAGPSEPFDAAIRGAARAVQGARHVVCLDPLDAEALRAHLDANGEGAGRVEHITAFTVADVSAQLEGRQPLIDGDVLYLDSCRLARGLSVVEPPRRVLAQLVSGRVEEAPRWGVDTGCCGAGAGYAASRPAAAAEVARAAAAGEMPVVSASPACAAQLRTSMPRRAVHDWIVLVARGLARTAEAKR